MNSWASGPSYDISGGRRKLSPSASGPRRLIRSARALAIQPLRRQRRQLGQIWGVTVVRDELDVLPLTLAHLLAQGVDHVLVADNRSVDGTREWLMDATTHDHRIHLALDSNPAHDQAAKK